MKKSLLLFLTFTLFSSALSAELYKPSRIVDVGIDAQFGASQNVTGITDLLVKDLVINFTEIANSLDDDGLIFNVNTNEKFFVNINTGEYSGLGFYTTVSAAGRFSTGKGIFEFLGKGNSSGKINSTFAAQSDFFIETGASYKRKIRDLGFTFQAGYYMPVYYLPRTEMNVRVSTADTGYTVKAKGSADFNIYSNFDLSKAFNEDFEFSGTDDLFSAISADTASLLGSGGINLGIKSEYKLFSTLDTGAYLNVPIVPGRLKYKSKVKADFDAHVSTFLDSVGNDETEVDKDYNYSFKLGSTEKTSYKVSTPLRLGAESAWRPFGNWLTFRPSLGLAVRNPYGDDFKASDSIFAEYSLAADMRLLYVMNFHFASLYQNRVFAQEFGFGFNFRVFEICLNLASSSSSFAKSWTLSGVDASLGLRFGF